MRAKANETFPVSSMVATHLDKAWKKQRCLLVAHQHWQLVFRVHREDVSR